MRYTTWDFFRYLNVSKKDRQWGLYVTGAGRTVDETLDYDASQVHPSPWGYCWEKGRMLPEYQAWYVVRGEGEFESETAGRQMVYPGNVLLLFPSVWHRFRPRGEPPVTFCWVGFNGDYAQKLVRRKLISPDNPILATSVNETIFQAYRSMLDRVNSSLPGVQQLIAANTLEILGVATATAPQGADQQQLGSRIEQARRILEQHTENIIDLEQLAASVGLGYDRFRQLFKQQTEMSPYQYHLQLRLTRAKELLQTTSLPLGEIAQSLGFSSSAHFSNLFRRKAGMWPTQWRGGTRSR